jgi:cysteine-rich repeat protein
MGQRRHRRVRWAAALCSALAAITVAASAHAHGQPAELAFWGGFAPDAARCQRALSRATALCIGQVAAARSSCLGGALNGATCDPAALDARVAAARQQALDRVGRACTTTQLQNLGYVDQADALSDVATACRQLDTAVVSAAFGPAMVGGTVGSVDPPTAACVQAGALAAGRLLRTGMRTYAKALDRIAALEVEPAEKRRLVEWAARHVAQTQAGCRTALTAACRADAFAAAYGRSVDAFLAGIAAQAACMQQFVYVQDAVRCPTPVCGNGMQEPGEECDDGNDYDGDGCRSDCVRTECAAFANTFDLIQRVVFENHSCTAGACHGSAQSGGLDLRAGASYDALIDVPSSLDPARKRIEPGDPQRSVLFLKLAAKTLPAQYPANQLGIGTPMPQGPVAALSQDELEAVRLWIAGAAPRTGSVKGVGDLLHACTPEPQPVRIKPLEPLPAGEGVQLHMPPWIVDPHSEHEVCFASYYDVSDQVPAALRGPGGDTFCYNTEQLRQDPLSHHLIVNLYVGDYAPDDPGWGPFRCAGGPRDGAACAPTDFGACGAGGECATPPAVRIGCTGFGPPDNERTAVPFAGAQQTNATNTFPDGAYRCVPLQGMIMWNSHAFNLSDRPGTLEAWLNFRFAQPDERRHLAQGIFDASAIFNMVVPACQQQEVCNRHVMADGAQLFELTSHMHQRGKRWRTFRGAFTCQGQTDARGQPIPCDPLDPTQCNTGVVCADPLARDPMQSLLYTSFLYNDPVQLRFNPPLAFAGSEAERSLTYCALYDNGFTDPSKVKRQSTSPLTPLGTSTCPQPTTCYAGRVCQPCSGGTPDERDRSCDSTPGAGDGQCGACTLTGGVTTEDEMFLLLGSFYQ